MSEVDDEMAAGADPLEGESGKSEARGRKPYRSKDERVRRLVAHLVRLAESADTISESRAALAELRQAINDPLRGAKHVVPCLGWERREDEIWFYRAASLFALHRWHQQNVSLGAAFREVANDRGSDSIEGRFWALLSASPSHLFDRLIGAITLLTADEQPLDWEWLLDCALEWGSPEKRRQHELARDFYRKPAEAAGNAGHVSKDLAASGVAS